MTTVRRTIASVLKPSTPTSKTGMTALGDRAVPSSPDPSAANNTTANRAQISTYFTKVQLAGDATPTIYNGDRIWARVVLTLETAGPVVVGQSSSLTPVLSGKGQLLETGVPTPFNIANGTRLYIASTSVNRVKVSIESVPWLEQITGLLGQLLVRLTGNK